VPPPRPANPSSISRLFLPKPPLRVARTPSPSAPGEGRTRQPTAQALYVRPPQCSVGQRELHRVPLHAALSSSPSQGSRPTPELVPTNEPGDGSCFPKRVPNAAGGGWKPRAPPVLSPSTGPRAEQWGEGQGGRLGTGLHRRCRHQTKARRRGTEKPTRLHPTPFKTRRTGRRKAKSPGKARSHPGKLGGGGGQAGREKMSGV